MKTIRSALLVTLKLIRPLPKGDFFDPWAWQCGALHYSFLLLKPMKIRWASFWQFTSAGRYPNMVQSWKCEGQPQGFTMIEVLVSIAILS
ncbi:MAG TPA: prepilin-type N-terminal cleavage/methylation domain-containing protein, partial [Terriglobales bacterium]|nr:prepilin-type N-terminal cleavage/methylation domain-containing protein [Terriglobales bacterium]